MWREERRIRSEDVEELLSYMEPLIQTGSVQPLLHVLQEGEGGVGHCRLVQVLRGRLTKEMGSLIRREVERVVREGELTALSMQSLAPGVLQTLTSSPRWSDLVERTKHELRQESTEAARHMRSDRRGSESTRVSHGDSLGSTWNQSNFVFLQEEQVRQVISQLMGGEGEAARAQALNTLLLTQVTDLVGGEHWTSLKLGLRRVLSAEDPAIFQLGLKVHAKIFISASHFAVKEAFNNIVETVVGWYGDQNISRLLPRTSLHQGNPLHSNLVSLLHLVCTESKELPKLWVRYPQRYIQEMIEDMINLLSFTSKDLLSPAHVVAVLDPTLVWLTEWFHSFLSRSGLLSALADRPEYLTRMIDTLQQSLDWTELWHFERPSSIGDSADLIINRETLEFALFNYNLRFVCMMLSYKQAADIAPNRGELIASMFNFLFVEDRPPGSRRLVSVCLKLLLGANSSKDTISSLIDRLTDSRCLPDVAAHILHSIPVQLTDYGTLDKMSLCALHYLKMPNLTEFCLSTVIKVAADMLSQFSVANLSYRALVSALMDTVLQHELTSESKSDLAKLVQSHPSVITDRSVMKDSLSWLPSLRKWDLEHQLERLWDMANDAKEPGAPGFGDFQENINTCLTEIGICLLNIKTPDEEIWYLLNPSQDRSKNDFFHACLLKILIIGTKSLPMKIFFKLQQLDSVIDTELRHCFMDEEVIMDEKYFLLKFLLMSLDGIVGPREKNLPCLSNPLQEFKPESSMKTFKASSGSTNKHLVKLQQWIQADDTLHDLGWVQNTTALLKNVLVNTNSSLDDNLIEAVLTGYTKSCEAAAPECHIDMVELSSVDECLVDMMYNYGVKVLDADVDRDELEQVLKMGSCLNGNLFLCGILYLMCRGDLENTKQLMNVLARKMIWKVWRVGGLGEIVEWIVREHSPSVFVKLDYSEISPAVLAEFWISQVFLSIIDFQDLRLCILACILEGADYLLHLAVSLLSHAVLQATTDPQLHDVLYCRETRFQLGDYWTYMETLSAKYRTSIFDFMLKEEER